MICERSTVSQGADQSVILLAAAAAHYQKKAYYAFAVMMTTCSGGCAASTPNRILDAHEVKVTGVAPKSLSLEALSSYARDMNRGLHTMEQAKRMVMPLDSLNGRVPILAFCTSTGTPVASNRFSTGPPKHAATAIVLCPAFSMGHRCHSTMPKLLMQCCEGAYRYSASTMF